MFLARVSNSSAHLSTKFPWAQSSSRVLESVALVRSMMGVERWV